ncbi:hypothetical protein C8Q74DRAFT_549614 [Fomes fomentarius]|nr:hypothetical protein C8Q74DRAFT_549614 [Fomes fomentarius]
MDSAIYIPRRWIMDLSRTNRSLHIESCKDTLDCHSMGVLGVLYGLSLKLVYALSPSVLLPAPTLFPLACLCNSCCLCVIPFALCLLVERTLPQLDLCSTRRRRHTLALVHSSSMSSYHPMPVPLYTALVCYVTPLHSSCFLSAFTTTSRPVTPLPRTYMSPTPHL